jgi:uncharacterized membrane protein YczE
MKLALIDTTILITILSILGICLGLVLRNDTIIFASLAGLLVAWAVVTISLLIELINEYK